MTLPGPPEPAAPSLRIGIDLGGTKTEAIALDARGAELVRRRVASPRDDYDATLATIAGLVAEIERALGTPARVGVGIPGSVSAGTGLVRNANSTWLNGRPLAADLARVLGRPVRVDNDANCFAVSEALDGAGAGFETVFGVILGTGVGGGVVVGGRILAGANGVAGEWGHTPLPWARADEYPGPACWCGRRGCVETWLSGPALARDAGLDGRDAEPVATAAARGEAWACAAIERYADRLARALAMVIDVLDPHAIVLGGGLSKLEPLYAQVPQRWGRHVFSDAVRTRLLPNRHGDSSGVRGAAWLGTSSSPE